MTDIAEDEEWRPVVGHDGYEVSSLGRVRSLDRYTAHAHGAGTRRIHGRILHPTANGPYGYLSVQLPTGRRYVHRLVAHAFLGDVDGMDVDHLDANPGNNMVTNLRIVEHRGNMRAMSDRRTHCVNGHELTPENTFRRGRSLRGCRTCAREWDARPRSRKGQAA